MMRRTIHQLLFFLLLISCASLFAWEFGSGTEQKTKISSIKEWGNSNYFREPSFFLALKKPVRLGLFYDDDSLFRYVWKSRPLRSKSYRPKDLTSISGSHIDESWRVGYIRLDAKKTLLEMAEAFEANFQTPLVVISGYRSAEYQQRLWDLGRCSGNLCAPPGYSEHQLGLAIDIFETTNESDFIANKKRNSYIMWMQKYAHLYGWHQSYQKWPDIDGYAIEPWHWRYLGKDMATRLKNLGWTFTEFVEFQEAIERR